MEKRISIFENVKTDRAFRASTGLSKEEFFSLGEKFKDFYKPQLYHITENYTIGKTVQNPLEALFLILYYKKNYPTFDNLGISFGISVKTAHQYVQELKVALHACLSKEEVLPKRIFTDVEEMKSFFEDNEKIIVDATEIPIQRPKNEEIQESAFSGKKKDIH
jgi:hypothetical protein